VRFSFSSGSFPAYSLPAIFEIGHAAAADSIEIMLTPRLVRQGATRLRFLEEGFHLPIASVHSVMRLREVDEDRSLEDIRDSARLAAKLENCRSLVVHLPDSEDAGASFNARWLETVLESAEIVDRNNTSISIENPTTPGGTAVPDEWLSFTRWRVLIEEFGFRGTYDTSHAAASGWDLLGFAEEAGEEVDNIHLSDVGGRSYENGLLNSLLHHHRPPGTGDLQLERFLARLAQTGFSGLITLEISPLRVPWYWLPSAQTALSEMLLFCRQATGDARSTFPSGSRRRGSRSRVDH
jgi:sugar phosphate isomerase/epimerase